MLQNAYSLDLECSVLDEVAEEVTGATGARDKLTKFTYHDGSECAEFAAFLKGETVVFVTVHQDVVQHSVGLRIALSQRVSASLNYRRESHA